MDNLTGSGTKVLQSSDNLIFNGRLFTDLVFCHFRLWILTQSYKTQKEFRTSGVRLMKDHL